MPRVLTFLVVLAAFVGMLRLTSSCLDVTPIVVEPDAAEGGAGCERCITDPDGGCAPVVRACENNPRCRPVLACLLELDCLDRPAIDGKIDCTLPCAVDAGITNVNDEVVQTHLVGLVGCTQGTCAAACGGGDAGDASTAP